MFSRVGRLTTFGAHAISNCPFRRDKNCQAQKFATPKNDQIANFSHSISDPIRSRTTSIGSDPFIGVLNYDEKEVIKELELLDLDNWNSGFSDKSIIQSKNEKNAQSTSETGQFETLQPSIDLECPDFDQWAMENDYRYLMKSDITNVTENSLDLLDLQSWNTSNDDQNLIVVCGKSAKKIQEYPKKFTSELGEQSDDDVDETTRSTKNSEIKKIDRKAVKNEEADSFSSDFIQWNDDVAHNLVQSRQNEPTKFEFALDNFAKMVDWDAWNNYLGTDEMEISKEKIKIENVEDETKNNQSYVQIEAKESVPNILLTTPKLQELNNQEIVSNQLSIDCDPDKNHQAWLESYGKSSGPLVYFPTEEEKPSTPSRKIRLRRVRNAKSPVTYAESERSWTPESDDLNCEEKPRFKKRGVVLKPPADEETDRRRALNRMAAVKYREKKRYEKEIRKKEFDEVFGTNRILRQQEQKLSKEIRKMRQKLQNVGVL